MISVLQRVSEARVQVDGQTIGHIGTGLLVLLCAEPADTRDIADRLIAKLLRLRVFGDDAGRMNRSVQDVAGGLLIVSQFTLAADTRSGNRQASLPRRRLTWRVNSTTMSCKPQPGCMRRIPWPAGDSARTWWCHWSTTGR